MDIHYFLFISIFFFASLIALKQGCHDFKMNIMSRLSNVMLKQDLSFIFHIVFQLNVADRRAFQVIE